MVKLALAALALAACGDEHPFFCTDNVACVADGKAGICTTDGACAFSDRTCADGLRYHESAAELGGQCVGGAATGRPAAPFPLESLQTIALASGHDDVTPSCSIPGGRDVFFEITLTEAGRLYVDTLGSDFPLVLAYYRGTCTNRGAELACITSACSDRFQQWSDILSPGTYCFAIDEAGTGGGTSLVVRSELGPPAPIADIGTFDGNTCGPDFFEGTCGPSNAPEQSWFLMSCMSESLTIDVAPTFSGDLQAYSFGGNEVGCQTGSLPLAITHPAGPLWLVAEAASQATCGPVSIDVTPQ